MAPFEDSSRAARRPGSAAVDERAKHPVVWLRGEFDVSTAADLSAALARAIALVDADLVIDVSDVQFMDAAAVGVIVRTRTFLEQRSRSLTLRSPSPRVRRVFDLCGLAELLDAPLRGADRQSEAGGALGTWVDVPHAEKDGATSLFLPQGAKLDTPVRTSR